MTLSALVLAAALVVAVLVVARKPVASWWRATARVPDAEPNSVEASASYRRYLAVAAWAGGSARDWDRGVRPVLAELVELEVARRLPAAGDTRAAAARWLGPELWPLVDRAAPRSDDRSAPGPGRDALPRILRRLEEP